MLTDFGTNDSVGSSRLSEEKLAWLRPIMDQLELHYVQNESVAFRINKLCTHGFLVKVNGAFAYVPFSRMPWYYQNTEFWRPLEHYLKTKVFFGKVLTLDTNKLHVVLGADIPQLRETSFEPCGTYRGIALHQYHHGVLIEFGFHFGWQCGSMLGYVHKRHFSKSEFQSIELGSIMEAIYEGQNEKDHAIFTRETPETTTTTNAELTAIIEVLTEEPVKQSPAGEVAAAEVAEEQKGGESAQHDALLTDDCGQMVEVRVIINENGLRLYRINDDFKANFYTDEFTSAKERTKLRMALKKLPNGTIIQCKVLSTNLKKGIKHVEWEVPKEVEKVKRFGRAHHESYSIGQRIDEATFLKLKSMAESKDK